MDLSVIIVNYRSASYTLRAVGSALDQEIESDTGGRGTIEVLVIDNGSPPEDVAMLAGLPRSVKLIRNATNLGFAAGVNQGVRESGGKFLCLLNPDTHLFPRAFQRLLEYLYRFPDVAASGPRVWWDHEKTFLLPLVRLPTPWSMILESLATLNYRLSQAVCGPWHRRDLALWRSIVPTTVDMRSGVCLVIRRAALEQVGDFDPTYGLYFEDADWCRRVRGHGYRLAYVPDAEIVHYYNQSAQLVAKQSMAWMLRSRDYYLEKQFGRWSAALCRRMTAIVARMANRWAPVPPKRLLVHLGPQQEPPLFSGGEAHGDGDFLFEVSYDWTFALKAASFRSSPELRLPLSIWKRLQPSLYYTRLTDVATSREQRIWSWLKVEPPRHATKA